MVNNNIVCDIYNIVEDNKAKINDDERVDYERNNFKFYNSITTAPTTPRNIVSYNVDGLLSRLKQGSFLSTFMSFIQRMDADIVCLIEVRLVSEILRTTKRASHDDAGKQQAPVRKKLSDARNVFATFSSAVSKLYNVYASLSVTKYAGQLLLLKKSLCVTEVTDILPGLNSEDGRVIIATFPTLVLVSVYVPNQGNGNESSYRRRLAWDEQFSVSLAELKNKTNCMFIVAGDFNVINVERDVSGSLAWWRSLCPVIDRPKESQGFAGTTIAECKRFHEMMKSVGLCDTFLLNDNSQYSRHTSRGRGNFRGTSLRLDYFLIDDAHASSVVASTVHSENFMDSDHCPISLQLTSSADPVAIYWLECARRYQPVAPKCFEPINKACVNYTFRELQAIYHITCSVLIGDVVIKDVLTLFDGGATNGNFAHPHIFTLCPTLRAEAFPVHTSVRLGDQQTRVHVTHAVHIAVLFEDSTPTSTLFYILGDYEIDCQRPSGPLLILGVPSIFREFGDTYRRLTDVSFACFGED